MFHIKKSRAAKIILLCLSLTVVEKGWVTKTHSFELGAIAITQEALYALTLAGSMLWRACINSSNSAADRVLQEEINRLTNRNRTAIQETHSTVSLPTVSQEPSRSHREHIKPVPVYAYPGSQARQATPGRPIAQRISPAVVKQINHVEKSRAIVSHVTQEQITQVTYAAIPETEKVASQELVRHIAIDWQRQLEQRSSEIIRSAQANAYKHMFAELRALNPGWTSEIHPNGGVSYRAPNPQFYCYLGPSRQRYTHALADYIAEQRLNEQIQIKYDPYLRAAIEQELCGFLNNARYLMYGTLLERIAALVYVADFHIETRSFGQELCDVQKQIYAHYVHADGSICIDRLSDMTNAHTIIKKYVTRHKKIVRFFEQSCIHARSSCNSEIIKKEKNVDLNAIHNNRTNQCYRNMLVAFASGDMQQVEQIKNGNPGIRGINTLYTQIRAKYNTLIEQQEALSKDAYGILHFHLPVALQDPLYTGLTDGDHARLQSNPSALANFNDALRLRNRYKQSLHKAWNISQDGDPVVHQALYALIDSGTIPERIDKIHEVSTNPNITASDRTKIVQAFFLSNGIIKDFAEHDRAKSLQMPRGILEEKYAEARQLLNHLAYAERVCEDEHLQSKCAAAIECIQYAVSMENEENSAQCLEQAYFLYDRICNPIDDEKIQGTCGTGKQQDPGPYSPEIDTIKPSIPYCPGDQYQDRLEKERLRSSNHNPDKIPLPQPCGFAGQTLPSFGSDTIPAAEIDGISEGANEDTESDDEEVSVGEDDSFLEEIHVSLPVDDGIENIDDLMSEENQKEDAVIVVNEFTTLSDALVKVAGRGHSKGRTEPNNYEEKLAMDEVMSNPKKGFHIEDITMTDSRWPSKEGWIKMQQIVEVYENMKIEKGEHHPKPAKKYKVIIHYTYNPQLELFDDFKFKD